VAAGALDGAVGPHDSGAGAALSQPPVELGIGCGHDEDGSATGDFVLLCRRRRGHGDQGVAPGGEVVDAVGVVDRGVRAQLPGQ
jgi:hypothetical protein